MRKILVVVDLQNDFVTGPLGNDDTRRAAKNSVDLVSTGWFDKIIFTRDTHGSDYLSTLEGRKLPVEHCVKGTKGWEIIDDFELHHSELPEGQKELLQTWRLGIDVENDVVPACCVIDKCTFGSIVTHRSQYANLLGAIKVMTFDDDAFDLDDYSEPFEIHFCGVCTSICVLSNMCLCRASYPNTRIVLHKLATGDVDEESKQAAFKVLENIQCDLED